jgi:hypothetical protein
MKAPLLFLLGMPWIAVGASNVASAKAAPASGPDPARAAAVHPVADPAALRGWLSRVPPTRDFPPDFAATLTGKAAAFVVEMTTAPACLACDDLWSKLQLLHRQYGLRISVLSREDALVRSGRFGLPWVGNPVAWVRAANDPDRMIPVAIGTDHSANLARNIYLAFKMMTGVRPAVGVRAMAKFTGIVGAAPTTLPARH